MIAIILIAIASTSFAAEEVVCPGELTLQDGKCCNADGVCCPDLPSGECCKPPFDSDMCCGEGAEYKVDLLQPQCCVGENCCPAGGFKFEDEQCCTPAGICCELGADACSCKTGEQLTDILNGEGVPLSNDYQPDGCGAATWCASARNVVNLLTPMWTDSCSAHDKCYADCERTQSDCDDEFKQSMEQECEAYWTERISWKRVRRHVIRLCNSFVNVIHNMIKPDGDSYGGPSYRQGKQEFCTCKKSIAL